MGCSIFLGIAPAFAEQAARPKKVILIAGKPSHPPGMHEFNAGVQLLDKCFQGVAGVNVKVVLNGWPKDEAIFDDADAVVFYGTNLMVSEISDHFFSLPDRLRYGGLYEVRPVEEAGITRCESIPYEPMPEGESPELEP